MRSFYGCYLLRSLDPAARIKTYIGFTVNPRRRIRQHNGEITSGAWRTRRGRPWEMLLVVYGFPTQVHALQFEWAWQHPRKSKVVREVLGSIKTSHRSGVAGKVRLLVGMLNASPWCYFPLTLQFLVEEVSHLPRGCPAFPTNLEVLVAPLESLPLSLHDDEDKENVLGSGAAVADACGSGGSDLDLHNSSANGSSTSSDRDCDGSSDAAAAGGLGVGSREVLPQAVEQVGACDVTWGTYQQPHTQTQASQEAMQVHIVSDSASGEHSSSSSSDSDSTRRHRRRQRRSISSEGGLQGSDGDKGCEPCLHPRLHPQLLSHADPAAAEVLMATFAHSSRRGGQQPAAHAAQKGAGPDPVHAGLGQRRRGRSAGAAAAAAATAAAPVRCGCCQKAMDAFVLSCPECLQSFHTHCLAEAFMQQQQEGGDLETQTRTAAAAAAVEPSLDSSDCSVLQHRLLPSQGKCPCCGVKQGWLELLAAMKRFGSSGRSSAAPAADSCKGHRNPQAGDSQLAGGPPESGAAKQQQAVTKGRRRGQPGTTARAQPRKAASAATTRTAHQQACHTAAVAATHNMECPTSAPVAPAAGSAAGSGEVLQHLLSHLQQQYPDLNLPTDVEVLQKGLLSLHHEDGAAQSLLSPPSHHQQQQQQQQQRQVPAAGCCTPAVAHSETEGGSWSCDPVGAGDLPAQGQRAAPQHPLEARGCQQEAGGRWYEEYFAEAQQQGAGGAVDLCSSPEPLFQRLSLASPGNGKRARSSAMAAAAAAGGVADATAGCQVVAPDVMRTSPERALPRRAGVGGPVRHQTSLSDSSDRSSGGISPRPLAVRCRLNGTTPTVMAGTGRVQRRTAEAGEPQEGQATARACVNATEQQQQQQQEMDTICLLDSD